MDNTRGMTLDFWLSGQNSSTSTVGSWISGNANMSSNQVNFFDNTSNVFYITGVQVEIGTQRTTFDYRSYGTELNLCQRYFANQPMATGPATSSTDARMYMQFPVTMRVAPTIGVTGVLNFTDSYSYDTSQSSAAIATIVSDTRMAFCNAPNLTSLTTGRMYFFPRLQNSNRVTLDAEL
jgi:hypothetical protein